jgi:hypothetical protein
MTYEQFSKAIESLREFSDFEDKLFGLGIDLIDCNQVTNLVCSLVRVLEDAFNDSAGWVGFYCWDLDFGRNWEPNVVTDERGQDIPLGTVEDLWNIITNKEV